MPDNFSQATQRMWAEFVDQHGREWGASVEKNTGHPAEPVQPLGWHPPHRLLMPPSGIIRPIPKKAGRLHIDYDQWIQSIRDAHDHWNKLASGYAHATYGDKAHDVLEHPTPALLGYCGAKPMPVEPVLACREGNKWALGFPGYKVPTALAGWWETVQREEREAGRFATGSEHRMFPDELEGEELDRYGDLEEAYDPDASGGKRRRVRRTQSTEVA